MIRIITLCAVLFLVGEVYSQSKTLELRKISIATFDSAKVRNKLGLEEAGRMFFKYSKGTSESPYNQSGNEYTWYVTVEKTGRLFLTDSIKSQMSQVIDIKINTLQNDPDVKCVLYRVVNGKIKKINLDQQYLKRIHEGDTLHYKIDLKSAQVHDIAQLSYSIESKINAIPVWCMLNDIAPNTRSTFEFFIPAYLEYKISFKGFRSDQFNNTSKELNQRLTFGEQTAYQPTKSSSELVMRNYIVDHKTYFFFSNAKFKHFVATLSNENSVE